MRSLFLTLVFAGLATVASAQTHPCDITPTPNPTIRQSSVIVGFCHNQKDTAGVATTITAFNVYLDSTTTKVFTGPLTPIGVASASGLWYFESPAIPVAKGTHSVTSSATTAEGESARSAPFGFAVAGMLPSAPVTTRIR